MDDTQLPKYRQRKSEATRQRILDAAARSFLHKGIAASRLADIAEAAGTQAGSLYYHFDSKEELLEQVLDIGVQRIADHVRERLAALPADAGHRARIAAAIEGHLSMMLLHGDYTSANIRILGHAPPDVRARHIEQQRAYGATWAKLLGAALEAGEIRADADLSVVRMLLLGALNWSVEWYKPGRRSIPEIADQLTTMFFDGMGAD